MSGDLRTNTKLKLYQRCVLSTILWVRMLEDDDDLSIKRSTIHVFAESLGYSDKRRSLTKTFLGDANKNTWMLSSQEDDEHAEEMFCGENHKHLPEQHSAGCQTEGEREEGREQQQLKAR